MRRRLRLAWVDCACWLLQPYIARVSACSAGACRQLSASLQLPCLCERRQHHVGGSTPGAVSSTAPPPGCCCRFLYDARHRLDAGARSGQRDPHFESAYKAVMRAACAALLGRPVQLGGLPESMRSQGELARCPHAAGGWNVSCLRAALQAPLHDVTVIALKKTPELAASELVLTEPLHASLALRGCAWLALTDVVIMPPAACPLQGHTPARLAKAHAVPAAARRAAWRGST